MNREYLISLIEEYIGYTYHLPSRYSYRKRDQFRQKVYGVWACDQILEELNRPIQESPLLILEKFRKKMDDFSCQNLNSGNCFAVAKDVADDILDFAILTLERRTEK